MPRPSRTMKFCDASRVVSLGLICAALAGPLPLCAQVDANGRPMTEQQVVNEVDSSKAMPSDEVWHDYEYLQKESDPSFGEDGYSYKDRDEQGRVTGVAVFDGKDRGRRVIDVKYNEDGSADSTVWNYRGDGYTDTKTETHWVNGLDGRTPEFRHTYIYGRNAEGKPVITEEWDEEFSDGHWTRVDHRKPRVPQAPPIFPTNNPILALTAANSLKAVLSGTGRTIGHIADLKLQNLTAEKLSVPIPPLLLESSSGQNQHYACPGGQTVELVPNETKTVPMDGVCLVRGKPPVASGVSDDLIINTGSPGHQDPLCSIPNRDARLLLRIAGDIYKAADTLLQARQLDEIPYSDPKKKKEIVVQWCTWANPRIATLTGGKSATKEDLKKVVYKQVEEKGPMSPETRKKVDEGIDTIFKKVELTSAKAKDLHPPPPAQGDATGEKQDQDQIGPSSSAPPAPAPSP